MDAFSRIVCVRTMACSVKTNIQQQPNEPWLKRGISSLSIEYKCVGSFNVH